MSDLIERLAKFDPSATTEQEALRIEAADLIEAQLTEIARLREALERVRDLGSDGEHSGDRHAQCRSLARTALERKP